MNSFDLLLLVNVVLAAVALVRHRPAAFVFFANQVMVLRALSNIQSFGASPSSMAYLPASLFSPTALEVAAAIFLLATLISVIAVVLPAKEPSKDFARDLPALPWWINATLAAYFAAYVVSKETIFTARYGIAASIDFELAGFSALLQGLVLYELYRRVVVGSLNRFTAFGFVILFAVVVHFIKGQTGFAAGFVITSAFMLLSVPGKRVRTSINIAVVVAACIVVVVIVRGIRAELHMYGLATVDEVAQSASSAEDDRERTGEGLENRTNGTQNAAHVLMCVQLFDSGNDRGWRSITGAVLYTFQPSFLQKPLGFERPIDATWDLATHFIHGGGIHILADLYWNGGYLCVALMMLVISLWIAFCDSRYRSSFWWLIFTCMFTPPSLMGVGYGFNHFARGFFNGCIVLAFVLLARAAFGAARVSQSSPGAASPVLPTGPTGTLAPTAASGGATDAASGAPSDEASARAASDA